MFMLFAFGCTHAQVVWKDAKVSSGAWYSEEISGSNHYIRYMVPKAGNVGSSVLESHYVSYDTKYSGIFYSCESYTLLGKQGGSFVIEKKKQYQSVNSDSFSWDVFSKVLEGKVGSEQNQKDVSFACLLLGLEKPSIELQTLYIPADKPIFSVGGLGKLFVTLNESRGLEVTSNIGQ
ncbi:hypothetical protein GCM10008938_07050 [Deinococcus roseus]|uniref:Uncharacterized protein n=2 Tax=Deinococcus roseus TaxID=392414 RepID=A0ABQ2CV45_9DEIO|nr:hypothetical protein GCM10008938_07050 [Deinococcus roseus]